MEIIDEKKKSKKKKKKFINRIKNSKFTIQIQPLA